MVEEKDNIIDVLALKKEDRVLQIGTSFAFIKKYIAVNSFVKHAAGVKVSGEKYTKTFVSGEPINYASLYNILKYTDGYIYFFENDEAKRNEIRETIETLTYPSHVWEIESDIGTFLMTDAKRLGEYSKKNGSDLHD